MLTLISLGEGSAGKSELPCSSSGWAWGLVTCRP